MTTLTMKKHPVRFGLDQVDEVIIIKDQERPVFGLGARRFGIPIEDEIIDLFPDTFDEKPLTLRDLASVPNSPASRIHTTGTTTTTTTDPASSENHLIINPVHHGPITTTRIQTVKREFATSFAAYSKQNATRLSSSSDLDSSLFVSPPQTPHDASGMSQMPVPKRSKPNHRITSTLSRSIVTDKIHQQTPYQPARIRLDLGNDQAALCTSGRVSAFLFQSKGVRVKINNVPSLLAQKFGDTQSVMPTTDRSVINLTHQSEISSTETDAHSILSLIHYQYELTNSQGISVKLPNSITKFPFARVADLVPHQNRIRVILNLLGVLLDPDLHTPSPESAIERSTKNVNTSYRLQRWLTHLLEKDAQVEAKKYLAANEPLTAIRVLMESRQVVAACDLAMHHNMPRLALFLSSAAADPKSAHKYLDTLMRNQADVQIDLIKCIQLASLCLVVTSDSQGLPEWTPQALQGLSLTQALLHILAAMPLMPMVEIVSLVMTMEPILTSPKPLDAVLLNIVVMAACKESCKGSARSVMWTLANEMNSDDGLDHAVLATILAGLVAHGFQIDTVDYCKLITRASSELERLGYWELALKVSQLLGLVNVNRHIACRGLSELLARNVVCCLKVPGTGPGRAQLLPQDVWAIDHCQLTVSTIVEAKCLRLDAYLESSVLAMPRPDHRYPQRSSSSFTSPVQVPVRMSRRFNTFKLDSDKACEFQHVFNLLELCDPPQSAAQPQVKIGTLSPDAYRIAVRALRWLVPVSVLAGKFDQALNTVSLFEKLISTPIGQRALPGGLGRPAVLDAVLSVQRVFGQTGANEVDVTSVAKHLRRLIERRGSELDECECGAIRSLLLRINAMVTVQAVPNIMSSPSSPVSTTTSHQVMDHT